MEEVILLVDNAHISRYLLIIFFILKLSKKDKLLFVLTATINNLNVIKVTIL
jgi:hypothetical protein